MRLISKRNSIAIDLAENVVNVLVIEHKAMYASIVSDLYNQTSGGDGQFVLFEGSKEYLLSKTAEFVVTPVLIDFDNKKIVSAIHGEIARIASEDLFFSTAELNTAIMSYLDSVAERMSYSVVWDDTLSVSGLLKALNLQLQESFESIEEQVEEYIKVCSRILNKKVLFFLNLRNYFDIDVLKEIYKTAFYEKIQIIDIESSFQEKLEMEKVQIIDNDQCVIEF